MQANSDGAWILVTGATAGIGKALVARLATDGRNVIAAARDPARVRIPNGPGRVEAVRLDFEEPSTIEAAAGDVARIAGAAGLAGLVNMAGIIVEGPLEAIPTQALRRQFEVNVIGPVALTQAVLPMLAKARGAIVNIGAVSAHLTPPFYGPIAASKAALASLNDAMRLEFAQFGIRVFLIEPGAMKTGIFATAKAARDVWLADRPDLERRYRPAFAAMERAFEKSGADDPEVVVTAVIAVLSGRRARLRTVVGKGAGAFVLASRLPIRLRDRLVKSALGLSEALRPAN
ncbi:MAG: SDR family NAD(P)-dependent oxidoreductase [Hyphomicrobiales bacterium]|nr:SDR family NAD(P)-dependent oxidoreductase [Hyphomicrobiales bacterium]